MKPDRGEASGGDGSGEMGDQFLELVSEMVFAHDMVIVWEGKNSSPVKRGFSFPGII